MIPIILVALVILGVITRFILVPMTSSRPTNLGWQGGSFTACPDKMNCVSSTAAPDHRLYIAPIPFRGSVQEAHDHLLSILTEIPRHVIVSDESHYIHAEFSSLMMGFVDDSEFYIDADAQVIHVRSAARLGYGDMGVNRNRIEHIREQFRG